MRAREPLASIVWSPIVTLSWAARLSEAYGIPHVVYHARHLSPFDNADSVGVISGVASTSVVALLLLWLERSRVAKT